VSVESYNYDSIDHKKLIVQESEDAGRIADIDLAMIGAKAQYNWDDEEHGIEAMVSEVGRRAEKLTPKASLRIKELIFEAAEKNFRLELNAKENDRQAAIDAKAETLLAKLTDNKEITYADLPKPHYGDKDILSQKHNTINLQNSSLWDKNIGNDTSE